MQPNVHPSSSAAQHHTFQVSTGAGERIDKWLTQQTPSHITRSQIQRWLQAGLVLCNQQPTHPKHKVRLGDIIAVTIPAPSPLPLKPQAIALEVLYEDPHLIVVNKPPNMPMHPARGWDNHCLVHALLAHCQDLSGIGGVLRPGIVHRLDKDTTGVVVCAKNNRAHLGLSEQFAKHSVQRRYTALVWGNPQGVQGSIQAPLGRSKSSWRKRAVRTHGKPATTHWQLLEAHPPFAKLQMRLETGRTHQIRVHLAYINLPVVADPLYGQQRENTSPISTQLRHHLQTFGRQALHAETLGFIHPISQNNLQFNAPPPQDMQRLWQALCGLSARHNPTNQTPLGTTTHQQPPTHTQNPD